jgi:hypothetical protein
LSLSLRDLYSNPARVEKSLYRQTASPPRVADGEPRFKLVIGRIILLDVANGVFCAVYFRKIIIIKNIKKYRASADKWFTIFSIPTA